MLNRQRELTLPRLTGSAAPTATQLRVCLTLQFSVAAGLLQSTASIVGFGGGRKLYTVAGVLCSSCLSLGHVEPSYFVREECLPKLAARKAKKAGACVCEHCGNVPLLGCCPFEALLCFAKTSVTIENDALGPDAEGGEVELGAKADGDTDTDAAADAEDNIKSPFLSLHLHKSLKAGDVPDSPNLELVKRTKTILETKCEIFCDGVNHMLDVSKHASTTVEERVRGTGAVVFLMDQHFVQDEACLLAWVAAKRSAKTIIPVFLPTYNPEEVAERVLDGSIMEALKHHNDASKAFTAEDHFSTEALCTLDPLDFSTAALQRNNMPKLCARVEGCFREDEIGCLWRRVKTAKAVDDQMVVKSGQLILHGEKKPCCCQIRLTREYFGYTKEKSKVEEQLALCDVSDVDLMVNLVDGTGFEAWEIFVKTSTSHGGLQKAARQSPLPSSDSSQFLSTCSSSPLVFGCSNVAC